MRDEARRPRRSGALLGALGVAALIAGLLAAVVPADAPTAQAAETAASVVNSDFNPGYIVSDDNFFNGNAMSVAEIQNFLSAMEPGTCGNALCLKNFRQNTFNIAADPMCQAYPGAANESAATIIYKVAVTCGISPKTILVTLQKEQGLVTKTAPAQIAMDHAMGVQCPDSGSCDPAYAGFFKQVHGGAYWMKRYTQPPGTGAGTPYTSRFDKAYPVGVKDFPIKYNPNAACGTLGVTILNRATHVLYVYTPYTPNAAAMANLGGTGDACSSYGNRNFWWYWNNWFGSSISASSPYGAITGVTTGQNTVTLTGWALDSDNNTPISVHAYTDGVDQATATANVNDPSLLNNGAAIFWPTAAGTAHGYSVTIPNAPSGTHTFCVWGINVPGSAGANASTSCTQATVAFCGGSITCPTVTRIGQADRYQESAAISAAAFPSTAPVVYVASGVNFPDALSAAPAARRDGGPLLLTDPNSLPPSITAEITRLKPGKIVVVGGEKSVTPAVYAQLTALLTNPANISRISGADRYEVSRNVAATFSGFTDAYVVTGDKFPDALSADSIGAYLKRPVVLVGGTAPALDPATKAFFAASGVQRITIVGGPASVTTGIQTGLSAVSLVTRVTGADRYSAAIAANRSVFTSATQVYLASGENFPDALSGSVLAAVKSAPLYLVQAGCVRQGVLDDIHTLGATTVTLLGGTTTLTADVGSPTAITACFPS